MVHVKVVNNTNFGKWTANRINDENQCNEEAEYLISEPGTQCNESIEIHHACNEHVDADPNTNPCIQS